jgi:NADPH-dependent curcumin reductase CurA
VFHRKGWRTHAVVTPEEIRQLPRFDGVPLTAYLSTLGGTGLTAYVGLTRIARFQKGEDVFVSAAAGGVGTATGRFARLIGAGRLVGSTGSAAKVAISCGRSATTRPSTTTTDPPPICSPRRHRTASTCSSLADNVGGSQLAAAAGALREFGRVVGIGAIGQYNNPDAPPPRFDHADIVEKSLRIEGFLVSNYRDGQEKLYELAAPHLRSGRLALDETVVDGFEHIVDAFLGTLRGQNTGKTIVRDHASPT